MKLRFVAADTDESARYHHLRVTVLTRVWLHVDHVDDKDLSVATAVSFSVADYDRTYESERKREQAPHLQVPSK